MSSEVIEAVFRYSEENSEPLMLIASKNQIDWNSGYVNNWNTKQYSEYVGELRKKYSKAKVYLCRDHCGPGFKNNDIDDVYKTIDSDLENNFDLIHIDFCHLKDKEKILKESKRAIEYIKDRKTDTLIEVGTDENVGELLGDVADIENQIKFFNEISPIEFFVVQTGSLVKEINQVGEFNEEFIKKVKDVVDKYNIGIKEHNADYLNNEEIARRSRLVSSLNVAPQYGVMQTQLTLQKCLTYGIDFTNFLDESYNSKKWEKWLHKNTTDNKMLCSIIAGHYIFNGEAYKSICDKLNKYENFKELVIQEMMKNFKMYLNNLK